MIKISNQPSGVYALFNSAEREKNPTTFSASTLTQPVWPKVSYSVDVDKSEIYKILYHYSANEVNSSKANSK
jgi:hypothetical protein